MSDFVSEYKARNARHQREWRARHPEHREAHKLFMRAWRAKRKALGIKRTD